MNNAAVSRPPPASHPPVRTFRAADARAALAAVKEAFGADAVIVATREVPGGLLGRPMVEITAAAAHAPVVERPKPRSFTEGLNNIPPRPRVAPNPIPWTPPATVAPATPARATVSPPVKEMTRVSELTPPPVVEHVAPPVEEEIVAPVKGRGKAAKAFRKDSAAEKLLRRFVDRGAEEDWARALVQEAVAIGRQDMESLERAVRLVASRRVKSGDAPWARGMDRRVVAVVGPTGVGKTTTVAKMAARAILDAGMRVALVTVDTYRVGASDQLSRYGQIMRAPTFVARDAAQLNAALLSTQDCDLVLVDTAGRSIRAEQQKQMQMLESVPGLTTWLAMSLGAGARELSAVAERYAFCRPERVVLTKADEAVAPAGALAALEILGRPVACVTNGQEVPEDVHVLSSGQLVDHLLGTTPGAFEQPLPLVAGGRW